MRGGTSLPSSLHGGCTAVGNIIAAAPVVAKYSAYACCSFARSRIASSYMLGVTDGAIAVSACLTSGLATCARSCSKVTPVRFALRYSGNACPARAHVEENKD